MPFFPGFCEESWSCRIVVEAEEVRVVEEEESSVDIPVMCPIEVDDFVEDEDKAEDSENKPCISKRRRAFHIA